MQRTATVVASLTLIEFWCASVECGNTFASKYPLLKRGSVFHSLEWSLWLAVAVDGCTLAMYALVHWNVAVRYAEHATVWWRRRRWSPLRLSVRRSGGVTCLRRCSCCRSCLRMEASSSTQIISHDLITSITTPARMEWPGRGSNPARSSAIYWPLRVTFTEAQLRTILK